MKRKILIIAGLALFIVALLFSIMLARRETTPDVTTEDISEAVRVQEVNNRNIPAFVDLSGRLVAEEKIDVFSEVGGVLLPTDPPFRPGNRFKEGQTLIRINDDEFRQSLIASRSALLQSITQVMPDLRLDFSENYEAWLAYLENFDVNRPVPPLPEPASSQERYFLTGRNVMTQYHEIRQMEVHLTKFRIRAPFTGIVTEAEITTGTLVIQGQRLGQFIKSGVYELEATVSTMDLRYVSEGDSVELRNNSLEGPVFGQVVRVGEQIDPATQSVNIYIRVVDESLREGMFMTGRVRAQTFENVESLPRNILIDGNQVFVVEDGRARLRPLDVVHQTDTAAVVKGLEDGELIIRERRTEAFEGTDVEPLNRSAG
ncbi:efflux RND transporter periplasmic adaptor subunit [Cytophagaceae bacterium ABcell3]|nr:efflux RND transporter periplasmic adaptor subunit [Cytophagaceae bacterium ABcell3]